MSVLLNYHRTKPLLYCVAVGQTWWTVIITFLPQYGHAPGLHKRAYSVGVYIYHHRDEISPDISSDVLKNSAWSLESISEIINGEGGWRKRILTFKSIPCQLMVKHRYIQGQSRTCVPEVGIKGRDRWLHPTVSLGCNYLSLPLIPASGTQIFIWDRHNVIDQLWVLVYVRTATWLLSRLCRATGFHAVKTASKFGYHWPTIFLLWGKCDQTNLFPQQSNWCKKHIIFKIAFALIKSVPSWHILSKP